MNDLKIFTENIDHEALSQIYTLIKQPAFSECKVRIMPDVHAGAGCVIGFTADLGSKVIPNIVGVDIGCGMLTVSLGNIDIDFEKLDHVIKSYVPSGKSVHESEIVNFPLLNTLICTKNLKNTHHLACSIGTLGGGNHFLEIDADEEGNKYLVIHSGSRNLGKQVAELYQRKAIENLHDGKKDLLKEQEKLTAELKTSGRKKEIQSALEHLAKTFKPTATKIPKELCYLEDQDREDYLHDMQICQQFAVENRKQIANIILQHMGWKALDQFETIHNYIELETNMVRKGAISAKLGEKVLIPINMRDGCILGVGKGNDDWNQSAPHGAGRILSRSQAKQIISLEEFQNSMKGIYSSSVRRDTIDESPMVYKPLQEIIDNIQDTVEIVKIIKPIYNFKASD